MTITEKRFWSKVRKGAGCWVWTASKRSKGYGAFVYPQGGDIVQGRAHRYSWEIHRGEVPPGLCVLHLCDNPACVRPDHLFLGTKRDNNRDMCAKGRHVSGGSKTPSSQCKYERGESHHGAKLTAAKVREMRKAYARGGVSFSRLGREYGVGIAAAHGAVKGKTWAWLT